MIVKRQLIRLKRRVQKRLGAPTPGTQSQTRSVDAPPVIPDERPVYDYLKHQALLEGLGGKRILEIGPKHGRDSLLLADLQPSELVLIDLPSKRELVDQWLGEVRARCQTTYIEGNLLYLRPEQTAALGVFDLIFCLGVLYHNAEQLRMLKKLYDLCAEGGRIVVESSTTRNESLSDMNVVEICWPEPYGGAGTVTHHPSRLAIKSWMEMVGFTGVRFLPVYDPALSRDRTVLIGFKTEQSQTHDTHFRFEANPTYPIGAAT